MEAKLQALSAEDESSTCSEQSNSNNQTLQVQAIFFCPWNIVSYEMVQVYHQIKSSSKFVRNFINQNKTHENNLKESKEHNISKNIKL